LPAVVILAILVLLSLILMATTLFPHINVTILTLVGGECSWPDCWAPDWRRCARGAAASR